VAADYPTTWRKSSACIPSDCVEIASHVEKIWIRDSANAEGPVIRVSYTVWRGFISDISADGPASESEPGTLAAVQGDPQSLLCWS
jgi:Domain of unknown function (DUF397)